MSSPSPGLTGGSIGDPLFEKLDSRLRGNDSPVGFPHLYDQIPAIKPLCKDPNIENSLTG